MDDPGIRAPNERAGETDTTKQVRTWVNPRVPYRGQFARSEDKCPLRLLAKHQICFVVVVLGDVRWIKNQPDTSRHVGQDERTVRGGKCVRSERRAFSL